MSKKQHTDQCIGNYRLRRLLSRSYTTELYLAEHTLFHTEAVVKLLNGDSTENDSKKFLAQATLLTQLQHPHIIRVLDCGMREECAFLIMTYAASGTMRQRYPSGTRLPIALILQYVRQIASALQYIHQHHLIHRDIKPHNMLLGTHDDVMITDFNSAIVAQDFASTTLALQDFEGTVPYAAPEQLQGRPQQSSDLYALGIVVYEWLCGSRPFTGSFDEIVHQHLFVAPPPLREKFVEVPWAFEQVLLKALAKEPEQRFASVAEFASALQLAYPSTLLPDTLPEIPLPLSSRRQFLSPFPFTNETVIDQAG